MSLIRLDLSNNAITDLPEEIGEMKSMEMLTLDGNQLKKLPGESLINRSYQKGVTYQFFVIDSVGNLSHIQTLDVKHNEIHSIPDTVANLQEMHKLDFSHNMVTKLPW